MKKDRGGLTCVGLPVNSRLGKRPGYKAKFDLLLAANRDPELSERDRRVLCELVNCDGPKGCFPSRRYVASLIGTQDTHISRSYSVLEEQGYIDRRHRKGRSTLVTINYQPYGESVSETDTQASRGYVSASGSDPCQTRTPTPDQNGHTEQEEGTIEENTRHEVPREFLCLEKQYDLPSDGHPSESSGVSETRTSHPEDDEPAEPSDAERWCLSDQGGVAVFRGDHRARCRIEGLIEAQTVFHGRELAAERVRYALTETARARDVHSPGAYAAKILSELPDEWRPQGTFGQPEAWGGSQSLASVGGGAPWRQRISAYLDRRQWMPLRWGAPPGQRGCEVPPGILEEMRPPEGWPEPGEKVRKQMRQLGRL